MLDPLLSDIFHLNMIFFIAKLNHYWFILIIGCHSISPSDTVRSFGRIVFIISMSFGDWVLFSTLDIMCGDAQHIHWLSLKILSMAAGHVTAFCILVLI
jgi:hypothetical protein